jgi:hypothetical protein
MDRHNDRELKELKLKRILLAALFFAPIAAYAQQPQQDPSAAVYRQLLMEANDRVAAVSAQAQALAKQLEEARAELAKLKLP